MKINKSLNKKGISLIVLVITIIIMIIMAATIIVSLNDTSIINRSKANVFKNNLMSYQEELDLYIIKQLTKDREFDYTTLKADKENGSMVFKGQNVSISNGIRDVIKSINKEDLEVLEVKNGKLVISTLAGQDKVELAKSVGIHTNIEQIETAKLDVFADYYDQANAILQRLTLEEKIAQLYIVGASDSYFDSMAEYKFGGYLFFADSFGQVKKADMLNKISKYQIKVKGEDGLPLLTAIDEEGETVSRLGTVLTGESKSYLEYNGLSKFKNSCDLFISINDWTNIVQDVANKAQVLKEIGINLNFAPVVDMTTNTSAYIYKRTLKQDAITTAIYAKKVISSSLQTSVSYCLKHFPGYGSSADTHKNFVEDTRPRSEFDANDLLPFIMGINEGAECIMVTHNLVASMDEEYPSSLSAKVHEILRNELGYTGIIITDAINMGAIRNTYTTRDAIIYAINAGNDLICLSLNGSQKDSVVNSDGVQDTVTYQKLIDYVVEAVEEHLISENTINAAARRVIAWKCKKGLMGGVNGVDPVIAALPLVSTVTSTSHLDNIYARDELNNLVVIPSGFKVLTGTKVEEGIVIQDADGNEFVWIPVGNINMTGKANPVNIQLSRYTFDIGTYSTSTGLFSGTGAAINQGDSEIQLSAENESDTGNHGYYYEDTTPNDGTKATAVNIQDFKQSVKTNHGYYIARYEASYRSGNSVTTYIPYSKASSGTIFSGWSSVSDSARTVGQLWTKVSPISASAACRNMYANKSSYFVSDMMNSYAYDTAILFIQAAGNEKYSCKSIEPSKASMAQTGDRGNSSTDIACNIYDLALNAREWNTESIRECTTGVRACRSGGHNLPSQSISHRGAGSDTTAVGSSVTFRPILYIK